MYLRFTATVAGGRESGQLYAGISADTATAGYAIYAVPKRKESALALIAEPRVHANPKWLAQQKKRLGRRNQRYWYSPAKRERRKHPCRPPETEELEKITHPDLHPHSTPPTPHPPSLAPPS